MAYQAEIEVAEKDKSLSSNAVEQNLNKLHELSRMIGNTPLLGIEYRFRGRKGKVYAKCEYLNLTGSIKDRMALHILRDAYVTGQLNPGDLIAEATSGNTGIAFAALGRALGHPVRIYMPDWMSAERRHLIHNYGAEIENVSKEQGGFLGSIRLTEELAAARQDVFLPRQFMNKANVEAHETTTGPELWQQLESIGLKADAFVAGVGTGGTVMGVGRFLSRWNSNVKVHPVEPMESPTLSTGHKVGKHRIQGISDEFIPAIVELPELDDVIQISDGDSILMAQKLASSLGLAVGISSGCNLLAAIEVQRKMGHQAVVTTVFPDDSKKYLSTDLMKCEPVKDSYLSPEIALIGISTTQRSCRFCQGELATAT